MKTCVICNVSKLPEEFCKSTQRKSGRGSYCKPCDNLRKAEWRSKQDPVALRKWQLEYGKKWKKDNPEKNKLYERKTGLKKNYGITLDDYNNFLQRQENVCAICKRNPEEVKSMRRFEVDHNHETKKVRGILCGPCNRGLGQFGDDIKRLKNAIEYLEESL